VAGLLVTAPHSATKFYWSAVSQFNSGCLSWRNRRASVSRKPGRWISKSDALTSTLWRLQLL